MGNMVEVKIDRARVTLVGAETYKLAGRKFIKDLPKVIKGSELIKQYRDCGYFSVSDLAPKMKKISASSVEKKNKKVSSSKKNKKVTKDKKGKKLLKHR